MDDLISRQAAIRLITGYNGVIDKSVAKRLLIQMPSAQPEYTIEMQESDIDEAVKLVRDARVTILPSAQHERKKGKWVDDTYCDQCGWVHTVEPGFIGSVKGFKFCPNCGADMREET